MGWIVMDHRPSGESHAAFFTRELLGEDQTLLADAHVGGIGGTFYGAVRQKESDEVWALVVLTTGRPGARFGWKAMEERMGPFESECPAHILDLLSPTEHEQALRWRARCRARLARLAAVVPGVEVVFAAEFLTPDGPCKRFEAVDPGKGLFRAPSGAVYRLLKWRGGSFEAQGPTS
jgi:hypothetical protein